MSIYKTIVTKANLQYYHGKLKRLIDNIGDVKGFKRAGDTSVETHDANTNTTHEQITDNAVSNMTDTWDASSVTRTIGIGSDGQGMTLSIEDVQNADNNVMNFYLYLFQGSGGAGYLANTIYKKGAVDAKFAAINGMSFRLIDPTQPISQNYEFIADTLDKFTNKANYSYYDSEKLTPNEFKNEICLYPVGDEYYEYVFIEGPNGFAADDFEIEFIGSTKQDLTGYLKDDALEATDNDYIDALFVMDWAPGLYDSAGNMVKTWNEMISEVEPDKYYLKTSVDSTSGGLNIQGRSYPWPANGTILVLPNTMYTISSLGYSGENPDANMTIPLEAIFIPKKPDTWHWNSVYASADTMSFHQDMAEPPYSYVPNLRWIAGEVSNVSYIVPDPNHTGTGSPKYIDACKFFQMF